MGRYWDAIGMLLARYWEAIGTTLGLYLDDVGAQLGRCWDASRALLGVGRYWDAIRTPSGRHWDVAGTLLERQNGHRNVVLGRLNDAKWCNRESNPRPFASKAMSLTVQPRTQIGAWDFKTNMYSQVTAIFLNTKENPPNTV